LQFQRKINVIRLTLSCVYFPASRGRQTPSQQQPAQLSSGGRNLLGGKGNKELCGKSISSPETGFSKFASFFNNVSTNENIFSKVIKKLLKKIKIKFYCFKYQNEHFKIQFSKIKNRLSKVYYTDI